MYSQRCLLTFCKYLVLWFICCIADIGPEFLVDDVSLTNQYTTSVFICFKPHELSSFFPCDKKHFSNLLKVITKIIRDKNIRLLQTKACKKVGRGIDLLQFLLKGGLGSFTPCAHAVFADRLGHKSQKALLESYNLYGFTSRTFFTSSYSRGNF